MTYADIRSPVFADYILNNAVLEELATGLRWVEGLVWMGDWNCLLFQDLPRNRTMRWCEDGLSVFRAPSHFGNGQTRDGQGRLLSCSHQARCIYRTEHDGAVTTLVSHYRGKRLNSPNDVVVKSDGAVWFTDPVYGIANDYEGGRQLSETPPAVYRFDPLSCDLAVVADDFGGPNGIAFSPDESRLYISETDEPGQMIRVFEVAGDGKGLGDGRDFHKVMPGAADGMRCDEHGNVWSSAGDGVHCISPAGKLLGKILVPNVVSNIAFGGLHRNRLFIGASQSLYSVFVNVRGATWP
jgi:gluconolactonase